MKRILLVAITMAIAVASYAQSPEEKLKKLGIELPPPSKPIANFVKWRKVGNLLYIAGHGPGNIKGKLGTDLTVEDGYHAARQTGINILATLKDATGDLSVVKQFVQVRGMVNCTPDFYDQPKVINGFSDLMVEVFGEKGKHARAAVGQSSLPGNIAVEIEVVVELKK